MTIPRRLPALPSGEAPGDRVKVIHFTGHRLPDAENMLRLVYGDRPFDSDGNRYGEYDWAEIETVSRGPAPTQFLTIHLVATGMPTGIMDEDADWFASFTDEGDSFLLVQCSEEWFADWLATAVGGRLYDPDRGWVDPSPSFQVPDRD